MFFLQRGVDSRHAKKVCEECPVREICLEVALQFERGKAGDMRHGVWGGHTPEERARIARRLRGTRRQPDAISFGGAA